MQIIRAGSALSCTPSTGVVPGQKHFLRQPGMFQPQRQDLVLPTPDISFTFHLGSVYF